MTPVGGFSGRGLELGYSEAVSLDRVALGTIAMGLDDLIARLETETAEASDSDEIAIALLDVERQLHSCARRLNATLRQRS